MTEGTVTLDNRTFDDIAVGDSAGVTKTLTRDDFALFAAVPGDVDPMHLDERLVEVSPLRRVVGHSWGGGLISSLLGTRLDGPGAVYASQDLHFLRASRRARALHPPDRPSEKSELCGCALARSRGASGADRCAVGVCS